MSFDKCIFYVLQDHAQESHIKMIKKTIHLLQVFIITQLGCGSRDFKRNAMKKTTKGNHWGSVSLYCKCMLPAFRVCLLQNITVNVEYLISAVSIFHGLMN